MKKKQKGKKEEDQPPKKDPNITNEQIAKYLDYYVGLNTSPNYAVFIDGSWGAGKTWFINQFRDKVGRKQFLYVTLYGVTSPSEIEDQFFEQLHPFLASKPMSIGTKILKSAVKGTLKIDWEAGGANENLEIGIPKINLKEFLKDSEKRILIFDDLERCKMPHEEILGYINHFVEHQGQKVIILANQSEIRSLEGFQKTNEKLIGRKFRINAEAEKALDTFIEEVSSDTVKAILRKNVRTILEVNETTESENLRTLRHCVIEYQRLFSLLPEKAQVQEEFQNSCLKVFFTLGTHIRSGKLLPQDIFELKGSYYSNLVSNATKEKDKKSEELDPKEEYLSQVAGDLYTEIEQTSVPDEEFWYYFFEFGTVPKSVMEKCIDGCRFFVTENTPALVRLLHIWDLSDDQFDKYLAEVKKDFSDHKFILEGELKHIAGLFMFFAKNRIVSESYPEMLKFINKVIGELEQNNLIELISDEESHWARLDNAHAGFGFFESDSVEFRKVVSRLRKYQERRLAEEIEKKAPQLLDVMRNDPSQFFRDMTTSNFSTSTKYSQHPVLNNISKDNFLEIFLSMEPRGRNDVALVLKERYKFIQSVPTLIKELDWLIQLKSLVKTRMASLRQPTKFHLQEFEKKALSPTIVVLKRHKRAVALQSKQQQQQQQQQNQ